MTEPVQTAIYVVGGIAGVWLLISIGGALPLLMLAKVDLERLSPEQAREWLRKAFAHGFVEPQWLADQGFTPLGVYKVTKQIGNPHMVVWQRNQERTYLCMYLLLGQAGPADIVTTFDEGGLTTGTSKDGLLVPPRPGHWMQAFKVANAQELWKHHETALQIFQETTGQLASTQDVDFREEFVQAVRGHAAYVRSLPLWFLRIPYWYVARRYSLFGKSVREQFERQGGLANTARFSPPV